MAYTMPPLRSIVPPAVRIAGAGLGAVVAGPLGGAIGGLLGDALGGESSKLVQRYADKFGDKAAEKLLDEGQDALLERLKAEAPRLESVYRTALASSLKAVQPQAEGAYADWFDHWATCLASEETLRLAGLEATPRSAEDATLLIDRVLVRLDAQGAAIAKKSMSLNLIERSPLPAPLGAMLRDSLPEKLTESFRVLIVSDRYAAAWRELQLAAGEQLETLARSIKDDTATIRSDTAAIRADNAAVLSGLAGVEETLRRLAEIAVAKGDLTAAEARARTAESEAAEWKRKYLELLAQNPSLHQLLASGNLEAAAEAKQQQISRQRGEQARNLYELGRIQELRFDFAAAKNAYREAWQAEKTPDYGFGYAHMAQNLNRFDEAIPVYREILALYTQPDEQARTWNNLAICLGRTGSARASVDAFRSSIEARRRMESSAARETGIILSLNNLAYAYLGLRQIGEARKVLVESANVLKEMQKENVEDPPMLAFTLRSIGDVLQKMGKTTEAERVYEQALAMYKDLVAQNAEAHMPGYVRTVNALGILYRDLRRKTDAIEKFEEALACVRDLAQRNPETYTPMIGVVQTNLGVLYNEADREQEAKAAFGEALRILRPLADAQPATYLPALAETVNDVGMLHHNHRRYDQALASHNEALSIRTDLAQKAPELYLPDVAASYTNIGLVYRESKRGAEAETWYLKALDIRRTLYQKAPEQYAFDLAVTLDNLGNTCYNLDRWSEAVSYFTEAAEVLEPQATKNRLLYGDRMAGIYGIHAAALYALKKPQDETCAMIQRGVSWAYTEGFRLSLKNLAAIYCSSVEDDSLQA